MQRSGELLAGLSRAVRREPPATLSPSLAQGLPKADEQAQPELPHLHAAAAGRVGGGHAEATYGRLVEDLRRIGSARSVAYWGIGEPLVHLHLGEMIRSAHTLGLETEVIANAQLLDAGVARGLAICPPRRMPQGAPLPLLLYSYIHMSG